MQEEQFMLMQAGLSYRDWRCMAPYQRMDYAARVVVARDALQRRMNKAKDLGEFIGLLAAKLMGLF